MSNTNTNSKIKVHGDKKINYLDFQFTRHLASCNNIDACKLAGKYGEPAAAYSVIINQLNFAQENKNQKSSTSDTVYVSNILRT